MSYRSPMQRAMARLSSFICRSCTWLLIIASLAMLPDVAHATCTSFNVPDSHTTPSVSPMASGGTISINIGTLCDGFGLNPYPGPNTTNPLHGNVSVDAAAGIVTYTNDGSGATSDSFVVADASGNPFTINVAIGAATSPITVSPASLPAPQVGTVYSQALSATGGTAPYSFNLTGGTLPPGLTLSAGTISGTPNQAGSYSAVITVTDSASLTTTKSYTVTVPNPSAGITVANPPNATLNTPYSRTLVASGALAPYTFSLNSGTLPPGMSLAANGVLSGTPTSTGTYNFAVAATDASPGPNGPYFKVVNVSMAVQSIPPTAGSVSATVAYDSTANPITLNISGATATSVAVASAPAHGTATASGTSMTYTPTTGYAGPDTFTYTATNGAGTSSPATVTVTVSPPTISYTPTAPPRPTAGMAYSQTIANASGGGAPYTYTVSTGALPAGLTLAANGTVSGTATVVGTFTFKVVATDSSTGTGPFSSAPANVTLTVNPPTIALSPASLVGGTASTPYSQTVTASGGTAPYTYVLQSGSLPAGMTLSSSGLLSGTPTQAGSFNITVAATDVTTGTGAPFIGLRSYTLAIAGPSIALSPGVLSSGTVATAYSQTLTASGGTAPYTFSATGALPPGLTLSAGGVLSGTPTTSGTFSFTAVATDAQSFTASQVYTVQVTATLPAAPTGIAATAGDQEATVSFSAPSNTGGASITGYTVTSSPGGFTGSGAASPITVTGLTNGTGYTFTVTATNSAGTGPASVSSPSVTPRGAQSITFSNPGTQNYGTSPTLTATSTSGLTPMFTSSTTGVCTITSGGVLTFVAAGTCTIAADQAGNRTYPPAATVTQSFAVAAVVPGAPTIGTATPGNAQVTVSFVPPASSGGAAIAAYTVTSNPGGMTGSGAASPITVTGLTNGSAYTFTVSATNSTGTGSASAASASVTPKGTQTITFNNPGATNFGASPQIIATASSGLPVSFTSTTSAVCAVTPAGIVTTLSPGTCTIQTDQAGNGAFLAAATVVQSFAIVVPGGIVSFATPSPLPTGTGGVPYSLTFTAVGGATPYVYQLVSGSFPTGLILTSSGSLSGAPASAGTYTVTVRVTDAATQTADKTYQVVVNAPAIALAPATLPQGKVGVAYSQTTLSASGGTAPYTYAVTAGALPAGLTLSPSGVLSGTPTTAGSFNVSVTATDKLTFKGMQAYTIAVGQPAPIAVNDAASTGANSPVTIPVTADDTGPITSLAITQQPLHGTAVVSGLNVVYTPATNYFGTDTLNYTATGPGGTSAAATVNITVIAGALPVAAPQVATVLAGKSVTIHAVAGATNGPVVSTGVVTPPISGSAAVQGTDIVYTAAADASGTFGFDYTVSNPFGTSKPAHVTLTVNPMPVAPTLNASVVAGNSVQVNLTATAHGGPFTGAKLVSISPTNAGSATIQSNADGYALSFTAAPGFGGPAQLSYTLSNAFAESAPGIINVSVTPRSDPSKNAEVLGVLDAQADAARRVATGQIGNFQHRLEALHAGNGDSGVTNGITMNSASSMRRPGSFAELGEQEGMNRYLVNPDADDASVIPPKSTLQGGSLPGGVAVWTGGAINFGKMQAGTSDNGIDFTTSGLSMGVDKAFSNTFAAGIGVGYGHDASDIGQHGSRSALDSYNVALYGSFHPANSVYIDGLLGYQWLQFDARRYVTDNGNTVHGSRDGEQFLGSLSVGYEHQADNLLLTPYGRLDVAQARLDAYTETGDAIYALAYRGQTVKTSTGTLGLLAQWTTKRDYGVWSPQLRAEFGHDMQGSDMAIMRYADVLNGPLYQATLMNQSRNHTMLGAGLALQTLKGWLLRFEYQSYFDNTSSGNQSILLGVEKKFDP